MLIGALWPASGHADSSDVERLSAYERLQLARDIAEQQRRYPASGYMIEYPRDTRKELAVPLSTLEAECPDLASDCINGVYNRAFSVYEGMFK